MIHPGLPSPIVFMFAGQGSQYFQMGQGLYEAGGTFARWMRYLDKVVLDKCGLSVLAMLYGAKKKSDPFVDTSFSHPAIFMIEVALAQELIERGIRPDLTLGVSMGSFAAAVVAGCIDVEDAAVLVVEQANAFIRGCTPGGMIAVLTSSAIHRSDSLQRCSVIASYNFDSHFVLSARAEHLPEIAEALRACGATFQLLPVAFAYHSPWIEEARSAFEVAVRQVIIKPPKIPLVCCARSDAIKDAPSSLFWEAAREPIRFQDTITCLEAKGPHRYLDVGATGTLATFVKYLLPADTLSTVDLTLTPYGRDLDRLHSVTKALGAGRP
jgi:bacillaene synthase trans-acting acyltransferase